MKRTQLTVVVLAMGSLGAISGCRNEFVTPVVASRVVVVPEEARILEGEDLQFTATVFDDRDQAVVRAVVTWSTSDRSIVRVGPDGRAWGLAPGASFVWATFNGTTGSALMTVAPALECGSGALVPARKSKKKDGGDDDDDSGCSPHADTGS